MSEISQKRASGLRPKKRKRRQFLGNQHTPNQCDTEMLNTSASSKKLASSDVKNDYENVDGNFDGYVIMDKNILFTALEQFLCCKQCHSQVSVSSDVVYGLLTNINIICKECGLITALKNSKMIGEKKNASDVNRRFVFAMRCIGKGYSDMKSFCGTMDLSPPVTRKAYNKIVRHIKSATHIVAENSMKSAVKEEVKMTEDTNLTVSGDGSWKTRGHSSLYGVSTLIGSETGKVVDRYVSCSYCKGCEAAKNLTGEDLKKWKSEHEKVCTKNHSGSSGQMEVNGMISMFTRSEEKHGVRYLNYVGDGDCKTFLSITKSDPYSMPVSKIECVGHVQKRMGSRLRKLKSDFGGKKLSDKKTIGGKGRLTDSVIDKLTTYYGMAIRQHSNDYKEMQKAIWAIWYHKRSNDKEAIHDFCPKGTESWCQYNVAKANGTLNKFKHINSLPVAVMDAIKPIFKDLSHPTLLKRCIGGKTQNTNESLNSLIWTFCSKEKNSGRHIVETSVNLAVANFNDGKKSHLNIMRQLGITPGMQSILFAENTDQERIANAEKRVLCNTLEARRAKRQEKKRKIEIKKRREGVVYAPGAF